MLYGLFVYIYAVLCWSIHNFIWPAQVKGSLQKESHFIGSHSHHRVVGASVRHDERHSYGFRLDPVGANVLHISGPVDLSIEYNSTALY